MTDCGKVSLKRFFISLPISKEISYADLIECSLSSQCSQSSLPKDYSLFMQSLITRGECFGISSKNYSYKQAYSDEETESDLNSFIDLESDLSSINSFEFQLAIEEGFYVVPADEFIQGVGLKRARNQVSTNLDEVENLIKDLNKSGGLTVDRRFTNGALEILKKIEVIIEKNGLVKEKVFKEVSAALGVGYSCIVKQLKASEERKKKEVSLKNHEQAVKQLNKMAVAYKKSGKKWNNIIEQKYKESVTRLEEYVELHNRFVEDFDPQIQKLNLEVEKKKVLNSVEKHLDRSGIISQPIDVDSQ